MKQFKYHLDKSSKKFNCPKCGKRRFVKYIETETDTYTDSKYGRCDRQNSCGYQFYPNETTIVNYNYVPPKPKKPTFIRKEIFITHFALFCEIIWRRIELLQLKNAVLTESCILAGEK